jgi:uncharacterized protein (DUF983 family)
MSLLVDAHGADIPDSDTMGCPKCGRMTRELIRGFGPAWRELCGHCGHEYGAGTDAPPEDFDE